MICLRILLVEDEPVIAQFMQYVLKKNGHQVLHAEEQADFQPVCAQFQPDLVILNFRQRHWPDGMVLGRSLWQMLSLQTLLVTGARSGEVRASQAYDVRIPILYKPFTGRQLCHSVDTVGRALAAAYSKPDH